MVIVLKSGSLNLLESLGSVQACNGIALSLLSTLRVELQAKDYSSVSDVTSKFMSNEADKTHAYASVLFFGHDLIPRPQKNPSKRNVNDCIAESS